MNLKNHLSFFSNTLYCDIVYDNIISIIHNMRKLGNIKPETKALLDEFETDVKEARNKGTNDSGEVDIVMEQRTGPPAISTKKPKRKTRRNFK